MVGEAQVMGMSPVSPIGAIDLDSHLNDSTNPHGTPLTQDGINGSHINTCSITVGSLTSTGPITVCSITTSSVDSKTVTASAFIGGSLIATNITASTITGSEVNAVNVNACSVFGNVTSTSITACDITASEISAVNIRWTGSHVGNIVDAQSVTTCQLTGNLYATWIYACSITVSYVNACNVTTGTLIAGCAIVGDLEATNITACTVTASGINGVNAVLTGSLQVDDISEYSSTSGVTIDGVLHKDNNITATGVLAQSMSASLITVSNIVVEGLTSCSILNGSGTFGNTNSYVVIDGSGNLAYVGGGGVDFGSLYLNSDVLGSALLLNVSLADTWFEVNSKMTQGQLHNVTFGGSYYLQVSKAGLYWAMWGVSAQTAAANQEIMGGICVSGIAQTSGNSHGTIVSANKSIAMAAGIILDLAANQQVSLCVMNHTAGNDITIEHVNLALFQVGGT